MGGSVTSYKVSLFVIAFLLLAVIWSAFYLRPTVLNAGTTNTPFVTNQTLGAPRALVNNRRLGFKITIGSSPVTVTQLGRWIMPGNTAVHNVYIVRVSDKADLGSVSISTVGATSSAFSYATLAAPVTLAANTAYYIVSDEMANGDKFYDDPGTVLTTTAIGKINNSIWYDAPTNTYNTNYGANHSYVPVSFMYVTGSTPPAPTAVITANPSSIFSGQSSTLAWGSTNATSCSGSGFTATSTSGTVVVSPTSTQIYGIVCTGIGGSASQTVTVTVGTTTDTTAPTVPTNLSAFATSSTQINLAWTASTDPTVAGKVTSGVSGYKVYRDGVLVGGSVGVNYSDVGLSAGTTYTYAVSAYDAAGNVSAQSASVQATTPTAGGSGAGTFEKIQGKDIVMRDVAGNEILAQAGDVHKFGDTYYWYGVRMVGQTRSGTSCYSSTDLSHWTYQGVVHPTPVVSSTDQTAPSGMRPTVLYNSTTLQYVMIFQRSIHIATSATPCGTFVDQAGYESVPNDRGGGDRSAFQDDDGKAYVVYATWPPPSSYNTDIGIVQLTPDYLHVDHVVAATTGMHCEAPYILKRNGIYYLFASQCAGYSSSATSYATSSSLAGPWSARKTVKTIPSSSNSYNSQHDQILAVPGAKTTSYVYYGDRWSEYTGSGVGKNVVIPLTFDSAGVPTLNGLNTWYINATTGEWSPTAI